MIGKMLYNAKMVDDNIVVSFYQIIKEQRNKYKLDRKYKGSKSCYKDDVGVVLFLTKQEAVNYLISELEHFVKMGEQYLERTKSHLDNAKGLVLK